MKREEKIALGAKIVGGAAAAGGIGSLIWYFFFRPPPAPPEGVPDVEVELAWD